MNMQLLKIRIKDRPGTVAMKNIHSYEVLKWSFLVCFFNPIFSCPLQILLSLETFHNSNVFIYRRLSSFQGTHSCVCSMWVAQSYKELDLPLLKW